MRQAPKAIFALAAATTAIVAAYGCRDATQVTLVVSTSKIPCGALMGVQITVAGSREAAEERANGDFVTATAKCPNPNGQDIGTLVLTPGESGDAAVIIVAGLRNDVRSCKKSNNYAGCIVARRSLSFREHVSATLPVALDPACVDVPCDVASTCKKGECITATVDCNDDGECVSADPRGRVEEDASVDPLFDTGTGDGEGGADATPSDSPADGDTGSTVEAGIDASTAACMTACPPGAGLSCNTAVGEICCYIQGATMPNPTVAVTICTTPADCLGRVTQRGIAACCWENDSCPVGKKCCFKRDLSAQIGHPEPYGQTYCADNCAAAGAPENMCNLSRGNQDCQSAPSGNTCVAIGGMSGYTGSIFSCQP